nr:MAG TPA: hypothetical protein [Caudoviricetes sp.]
MYILTHDFMSTFMTRKPLICGQRRRRSIYIEGTC